MRILLLSPNQIHRYNWGHQLFRNELGRHNDVLYYGEGYPNYNKDLTVKEIIKKHCKDKPDIILTYGWRYTKPFKGLGEIENIPKVHIAVDYFEKRGKFKGTLEAQNISFSENKPTLTFGVVTHVVENLKRNKITEKVFLLPFCVDTKIYKPVKINKDFDVLASFTVRDEVYPNRKRVHNLLKSLPVRSILSKITHHVLVKGINRSKIIITSNNVFNSFSMRYTETLACGGFLLADKPEDLELLGYVDGKHLVIYKDMNDLKSKILYYLKNSSAREKIAKIGMEHVRKNHSCEVRAKEFTKIVKDELNIR